MNNNTNNKKYIDEYNKTNNNDIFITHNFKDITSKFLAQLFKGDSLRTYGFQVPKVESLEPTELPSVMVNDFRVDNLFKFEDGTYALVDYECDYNIKDKFKYHNYLVRIASKYYNDTNNVINIRMLVIYSANVKEEKIQNTIDFGAVKLTVESIILKDMDTLGILNDLTNKVENNLPLTDKDKMQLIILPLTCEYEDIRYDVLDKVIDLISKISDDETKNVIISCIIAFTDKYIKKEQLQKLKGMIRMTQIEQMYVDEANERLRKAIAETTEKVTREVTEKVTDEVTREVTREVTNDITTNTIKKMLNNGLEPDNISMYFDNITVEDIESIRSSL